MTDDVPPHRANGAEITAYYASREPDEEFAAILEEVHEEMNRLVMAEDPWEAEDELGAGRMQRPAPRSFR